MFNSPRIALLAIMVSLGAPVFGSTYTEVGDAGQTLATAQLVNTLPAGTPLDAILGNLEKSGADLFQIYLTGGQTFSATTVNSVTFPDTELFLFNSAGIGVYANDDDPNSPPQSTLPASITLTPSISGNYFLAIAGSGYLPISAGGYIFPVSGGLLDQTSGGVSGAVGPTGPGGALALTNWSSISSETGNYRIDLTGAQFLPSVVVGAPEPASFALLGGALLVAGALRRRSII